MHANLPQEDEEAGSAELEQALGQQRERARIAHTATQAGEAAVQIRVTHAARVIQVHVANMPEHRLRERFVVDQNDQLEILVVL